MHANTGKDNTTVVVRDVDSDRIRAVLRGHEKPVHLTQFNADASKVITASADQTIRVWDAATGTSLRVIRLPDHEFAFIRIAQDGQRAIVWKPVEQNCYLYDLDTQSRIATLPGHARGIHGANFSQCGDLLVTSERFPGNTLFLWSGKTGQLIAKMGSHRNSVTAVTFSPDYTRIATASMDQTVSLWNAATGQRIASLEGHTGHVFAIEFSPDSKQLVSGSHDRTVRLWSALDGKPLSVLTGHTAPVNGVTYLADGSRVVSTAIDGSIRLWDPRLGEGNGILRGHSTFVYAVAFHPDGEQIASAGWDGTVRIWDATTGREMRLLDHGANTIISSLAIHPNGRLLASRAHGSIFLWDMITGKELHRWKAPSHSWEDTRLVFSPMGDLLASGCLGGEIRIWDVENRSEVAVLGGKQVEVRDLVFSPDGKWLVSSANLRDTSVRIWDIAKKEQVRVLKGHTGLGQFTCI